MAIICCWNMAGSIGALTFGNGSPLSARFCSRSSGSSMFGEGERSRTSGVPWVPTSRPDRVLDIPEEEFGMDMVREGVDGVGVIKTKGVGRGY